MGKQLQLTDKVLDRIMQESVGSANRSEFKATEVTTNSIKMEACVWIEQFLTRNTNLDFVELQKELLSDAKEALRSISPDKYDTEWSLLLDKRWNCFHDENDIRWRLFRVEQNKLWRIFHGEWSKDHGENYVKSRWLLRCAELDRQIGARY